MSNNNCINCKKNLFQTESSLYQEENNKTFLEYFNENNEKNNIENLSIM